MPAGPDASGPGALQHFFVHVFFQVLRTKERERITGVSKSVLLEDEKHKKRGALARLKAAS